MRILFIGDVVGRSGREAVAAALPGRMRLGVAYAAQELDEVPAGPYDERLDAVATERGVIFCKDE